MRICRFNKIEQFWTDEMEAERWKKLEAIYHSTLAIEPGERDEFLQNICADDTEILREVKVLLASDLTTHEFLQDNAPEIVMKIWADKEKKMSDPIPDKFPTNEQDPKLREIGGRYEILEKLGEGGIGEIYKARDLELPRTVIIKFLQSGANSDWIIKKFKEEPRVQSLINDENVPTVFETGTINGKPCMVMEFIEGENLAETIEQYKNAKKQIPLETIAEIIKQTSSGVNAIHKANLIHRDLKPANLMLKKSEKIIVKIIDFGIARNLKKETRLGQAIGTPSYMPIEQLEGKDVAPESDVFALGVIAYQLVTLELPFICEDYLPALILSRQEDVKVLPGDLRPDLPKEAEKLILQALECDMTKRPQLAKEFGDELKWALTLKQTPQPTPRPSPSEATMRPMPNPLLRWLVAAAFVLVVAIISALWWNLPSQTMNSLKDPESFLPLTSTTVPANSSEINTQRKKEITSDTKSSSPSPLSTNIQSTEPQLPKPANDLQQISSTKDVEKFRQLLRGARISLDNELWTSARDRYESALKNLPHSFKGKVDYDSINKARASYGRELWHEAANQYEAAFRNFPRQ